MADETKAKTPQELRIEAVAAYYEAKTKEEKAAVVEKYPFLSEVFSASNHS